MGKLMLAQRLKSIALLAILVLAASTPTDDLLAYFTRLDLVVWVSFLTLLLASMRRGVLRGDKVPIGELIWFTGFLLVAAGRLYSVLTALQSIPLKFYLGGFIDAGNYSPTIMLVVMGLVLSAAGDLVKSWQTLLPNPLNTVTGFARALLAHPALVSGAIAFLVRLVPELAYSNYILGYDTVEYVAHLKDFAASPSLFGVYYWFGGLRRVPPLLDWLLYPFARLADPVMVFKLYAPAVYSIVVALTVCYGTKLMGLRGKTGIALGVAASFSLLMLRLSWDLMKQLLAELFFLTAVIFVDEDRRLTPLLFFALSTLASEFGGFTSSVSALVIGLLEILKRRRALTGLTYLASSLVFYYVTVHFMMRLPALVGNPVSVVSPPVVTYDSLAVQAPYVTAYLIVTLGPLLPFYVAQLSEDLGKPRYSAAISLALLMISLTPLVAPTLNISGSGWDRVLMTIAPLILASSFKKASETGLRNSLAVITVLITLPGLYAVLPGGYFYNTVIYSALYRTPTLLRPMPPDLLLYNAAVDVSARVADFYGKMPILAPEWVARFIHLFVRNPDPRMLTSCPSLSTSAIELAVRENGHVVVVLSTNDQAVVPANFRSETIYENFYLRVVLVSS